MRNNLQENLKAKCIEKHCEKLDSLLYKSSHFDFSKIQSNKYKLKSVSKTSNESTKMFDIQNYIPIKEIGILRKNKLPNSKICSTLEQENGLNSSLSINQSIALKNLITMHDPPIDEVIERFYLDKVMKQLKIDSTGLTIRKIGRPSSWKLKKSHEISIMQIDYLKEQIQRLSLNFNKISRFDTLIVEYFRIIRKVPNFFMKNFWTQIYWKSTDITKYTIGFVEAASAYNFAQNNFSQSNTIEKVLDFSVIYFSALKWNKIIKRLLFTSCQTTRNILKMKQKVLKFRSITTIKNIKELVNLSPTLKELFVLSLKILSELKDLNSTKSECKFSSSRSNWNLKILLSKINKFILTKNYKNIKSNLSDPTSYIKCINYLITKTKEILNIKV